MKLTKLLKENYLTEATNEEQWLMKNYGDASSIKSDYMSLRIILSKYINSEINNKGGLYPTIKPKDVMDLDKKFNFLNGDESVFSSSRTASIKKPKAYCVATLDSKLININIECIDKSKSDKEYPVIVVGRCPVKDFLKAYPNHIKADKLTRCYRMYEIIGSADNNMMNYLQKATTEISGWADFFKKNKQFEKLQNAWVSAPEKFRADFMNGKVAISGSDIEIFWDKAYGGMGIKLLKNLDPFPKGFTYNIRWFINEKSFLLPDSDKSQKAKTALDIQRQRERELKANELKSYQRAN